jgi:hypothetical protein
MDLLDWKASLLPRGEAARDLGRAAPQGHLRAHGVLAEVDNAGPSGLHVCFASETGMAPGGAP